MPCYIQIIELCTEDLWNEIYFLQYLQYLIFFRYYDSGIASIYS